MSSGAAILKVSRSLSRLVRPTRIVHPSALVIMRTPERVGAGGARCGARGAGWADESDRETFLAHLAFERGVPSASTVEP